MLALPDKDFESAIKINMSKELKENMVLLFGKSQQGYGNYRKGFPDPALTCKELLSYHHHLYKKKVYT